jgi:hypothetical protein
MIHRHWAFTSFTLGFTSLTFLSTPSSLCLFRAYHTGKYCPNLTKLATKESRFSKPVEQPKFQNWGNKNYP